MRQRLLQFVGMATIIVVVSLAMSSVACQTPATTGSAPAVDEMRGPAAKTPWGEPDLQGIWTRDADVPLQRPIKYGNRELLTEAERADLDRQISGILGRDSAESRRTRGSETDVNGEYNQAAFTTHLHVGR